MGLMRDLKNIEASGAAAAARSAADDAKIQVLLQLMAMNWPTLDKQAAAAHVDAWIRNNGLGGR